MSIITKDWITVREAAGIIKCDIRTVHRLAENGQIRRVKINSRLSFVHASDCRKAAKRPYPVGRPRGS